MAGLRVHLVNASPALLPWLRMTQGWNASLLLFHAALSSATPCRF